MAKRNGPPVLEGPDSNLKIDWSQVEWWELERLIPYPKNTKAHPPDQVTVLANAIRRFGWDVPIVVDENGVVLKGHCRRLAALELKLANVPVIVRRGLTEDEKRAIRISDNKLSESDWLDEFLAKELKTLKAVDFDLQLTGFSEAEYLAAIGDGTTGRDSSNNENGDSKTHDQQPISVKFPKEIDAILRDKARIPDRSSYIKDAVLAKLKADGLI
jgi:hypothetical protein